MQVTTVKISYRRVFNLGNYESLALECTLEGSLEEADTEELDGLSGTEACANELFAQAKTIVKAQAMPVIKKRDDDLAAIKQSVPGGLE